MASELQHGLAIPLDTGYVVVKFELVISSLYFLILCHLRHINSMGTSCTGVIESITMQLLNQGETVEKIIKKHAAIGIFQNFLVHKSSKA